VTCQYKSIAGERLDDLTAPIDTRAKIGPAPTWDRHKHSADVRSYSQEMREYEALTRELSAIRTCANDYFGEVVESWSKTCGDPRGCSDGQVNLFFRSLEGPLAEKLAELESRTASWAGQFASLARLSALLNAADQGELRIGTRTMIAALRLKKYSFYEASLMSWEDQVYGVQPATQSEEETPPVWAIEAFDSAAGKLGHLLLLLKGGGSEPQGLVPGWRQPATSGSEQRRDTAFILMWMSEDHPELTDVKEGITEVFREFGVSAIRADDIEHEGVITERILQEISSAEFLIADLTGARPNVYYEIGYAHALGKRPILYRKKDTALHFDLAGRNVPSYANVSDLKQMLRARLEALLGIESPVSKKRRPIA